MRIIPYKNEFDAVANMFSSYGYFDKEKENQKVLKSVYKSLKNNGLFLLDLPNKNWMLIKVNKKTWQIIKNTYIFEERSFDKKTNIFLNSIFLLMPNKQIKHTCTLYHLYELHEMAKKLKTAGFKTMKIYGNYEADKFNAKTSPRMIILAKKV